MKSIRISAILALIAIGLPGQAPPITYNVVVKDKKGVPLKTLSADAFELTDNGAKMSPKVQLFDGGEVVENGQRKAAEPARKLKLFVVVFERMNNEQRRLAKQIALDLFKEDKDPTHLYAVFMESNQLALLTPFTADKAKLRAAAELATSGVGNLRFAEVHRESRTKLDLASAQPNELTQADVEPNQLETNPAVQSYLSRVQLAMLSDAVIDDAEGPRRTITFLNSLSLGMRSHPGRKAISYFTSGMVVPTNLDVPFEALHARANLSGVSFYPIDCRGISTATQAGLVNAVVQGSSAQVDATENRERGDRPFGIENATEGLRLNVQSALRVLAETTGGVNMVESNDPKKLLREMISDLQTYYELTYDPGITDYNGVLRKTSLKLKGVDGNVRDRDGYLAMLPGQENLLPYELPMLKVLTSGNPLPRDVEFRSGTWKLRATKEKVSGILSVEVPFAGIQFLEDAGRGLYATRLTVLAQIKSADGKVIEKFTRDLPLKGKLDQLAALKNSNFNFRERFNAPPGRYIVETVVFDQVSGKMGARKTSLVAGASASILGMSSIALIRNYQPNAKDLTPEDPFQYQGGRITPTLNTTLTAVKGAELGLFFTVYPDAANTAAPTAIVQYLKDGAVVGNAQLPLPAANGKDSIPYVLRSPLDAMPPGSYEVKVFVKQGNSTVAESVFLTIGA